MQWYEQVADPKESYEVVLKGRALSLSAVLLVGSLWLAIDPPFFLNMIVYRILFAAGVIIFTQSLLTDSPLSPMYAGPLVVITPEGIRGRSKIFTSAWALTWDEIDRFERSRNGILVFKKEYKISRPFRIRNFDWRPKVGGLFK